MTELLLSFIITVSGVAAMTSLLTFVLQRRRQAEREVRDVWNRLVTDRLQQEVQDTSTAVERYVEYWNAEHTDDPGYLIACRRRPRREIPRWVTRVCTEVRRRRAYQVTLALAVIGAIDYRIALGLLVYGALVWWLVVVPIRFALRWRTRRQERRAEDAAMIARGDDAYRWWLLSGEQVAIAPSPAEQARWLLREAGVDEPACDLGDDDAGVRQALMRMVSDAPQCADTARYLLEQLDGQR